MALGTLAIVASLAAVGSPVKHDRCTLVGDGAYPAGGSLGLADLFRAACKQSRKIYAVIPSGNNGDTHLEYAPEGEPKQATVVVATDIFTSVAHGLVSGDAVRFESANHGDKNIPTPALPGGIVAGTTYFVIATGLTADAFKVSATSGGAALDITTAPVGGFDVKKMDKLFVRVMSTGVESGVADQSGSTYNLLVISG